MSYTVFARKYRPRTFDDVLGQDHVVRTLRNAVEQDRLAHAYLFVGPRGTGKTSTARIFAKALNCSGGPRADFDPDEDICIEIAEGRSLDVLEIDGASNNGVEQVRELRETVNYAPARGRFKIYYIDEVHMLTPQAFNALLKTLEEPPPHVKFIFATTEPNKILPTILSRCQRFDLRPLPPDVIARHLQHIAQLEGIDLEEAAAWSIARGADGGMRDAQSMLDQLVAFCGEKIIEHNVQDVFGFTSTETVAALAAAVFERQTAEAVARVQSEADRGKDLSQLLSELTGFLRALLIKEISPEVAAAEIPSGFWEQLRNTGRPVSQDQLLGVLDRLADAETRMRRATNKQLHFEIALIRAVQSLDEVRIDDVIKALDSAPRSPAPPAPAPKKKPAKTAPPEKQRTSRRSASSDKKPDIEDKLATLIDQAPDAPPAPEQPDPPPSEASARPSPSGDPPAAARDPFYDDPLVHDALRIFEGKLKE